MSKVLVIDDSPTVKKAIKLALTIHGHEVEELDLFIQLASKIREFPPDVVVLDLEMPGFSGTFFAKFIREECKCDIPIIIYSSCKEEVIQEKVKEIGNAKGIQKGNMKELNDLIINLTKK